MADENIFQGIDTLVLRVSQIEHSKKWYQEKLGLAAVWEDEKSKLVVLDTGGPTSLTLWQTTETNKSGQGFAAFPIFKTGDAEASLAALQQRGVRVGELTNDGAVSYFTFYDPDGNILEACQVHL